METLDELKQSWKRISSGKQSQIAETTLDEIVKERTRRESRVTLEYFWSSFVYQNLVYGLCAWLIATNVRDVQLISLGFLLAVSYLPFTIIMMKRFKEMNRQFVSSSIKEVVEHKLETLLGFFRFKKTYELIVIPVTCLVITLIFFKLYSHSPLMENTIWIAGLWAITTAIFAYAVSRENQKRFRTPLAEFRSILDDLQSAH